MMQTLIKRITPNTLFTTLCLIGLGFFIFILYITKGECLNGFLFEKIDMFMDFYNSVRNAYMENPYEQIHAIYPPLVFLLCRLFGCFIPSETIITDFSDYQNSNYDDLLLIKDSRGAFISYACFCSLCFLLICIFVKKICNKNCFIILTIMGGSYSFWYTVDRGNTSLLSAALLIGFAAMKNSRNKLCRETALLLLSIAINLKIYPVLFAFLFLTEKKYISFIKSAIYSALLFFLPFTLYGGVQSFILIIQNVFTESSKIGLQYVNINFNISSCILNLSNFYEIAPETINVCTSLLPIIVLIIGVSILFFINKDWKKYLLITCIMLLFPSTTAAYNGIYMIVPFLLFYRETNKTKVDYLYAALFSCCFISIPICFEQNGIIYSVSFILLSMAICIMTILLFEEGFFSIVIFTLRKLTKTDNILDQIKHTLHKEKFFDKKFFDLLRYLIIFIVSAITLYGTAMIYYILNAQQNILVFNFNSYVKICYIFTPVAIILTIIMKIHISRKRNIYVSILAGTTTGFIITIINIILDITSTPSNSEMFRLNAANMINIFFVIILCGCLGLMLALISEIFFVKKRYRIILSVGILILLEIGNGALWTTDIRNNFVHYFSKINPMNYLTVNFGNFAGLNYMNPSSIIYTISILIEITLLMGITIILNFGYLPLKTRKNNSNID